MFQEMDLDKDGIISGQQLQAGLASLGTDLTQQDIAEFLLVSKVQPSCLGHQARAVHLLHLLLLVRLPIYMSIHASKQAQCI
jgi:hypothetical protein